MDEDEGEKIDAIVEEVLQVCDTPLKKGVTLSKESYLTAQANCSVLQILNESLVQKAALGRKLATRKHHGEARVLTVKQIQEKNAEREAKEAEAQRAKERRAMLRGKAAFARLVWKEMPVTYDIFE